jgi:hypothetical protein
MNKLNEFPLNDTINDTLNDTLYDTFTNQLSNNKSNQLSIIITKFCISYYSISILVLKYSENLQFLKN